MKYVVFAALAMMATQASADSIKLVSELRKNGTLVERFVGSAPDGKTQRFGRMSPAPYRAANFPIGGGVEAVTRYIETGFQLDVQPWATGTGDVKYHVTMRKQDLVLTPEKIQGVEIDRPHASGDQFTQTVIVKSGAAHEFPFRYTEAEGEDKYVLTVTAWAVPE